MYCQTCSNTVGASFRFCPKCGGRSLLDQPPTSPTNGIPGQTVQPTQVNHSGSSRLPASQSSLAGFWIRVVAGFVDFVLVVFAILIVGLPVLIGGGLNEGTGTVIGSLVGWIYFAASESSAWQATPAKRIIGLCVVDRNGNRIGFWQASLRYLLKMPACLFISLFMIAFRSDKRGVHDLVAGTFVNKL